MEEDLVVNDNDFRYFNYSKLRDMKDRYHIYGISYFYGDYLSFPIGTYSIGLNKKDIKFIKNITGIYFSKTVKDYASYNPPFKYLSKLEEIDLGDSQITFLYKDLFKNCKKLKTVILPNYMEVIEEEMFINCKNLTTVIGKGIKHIKNNAFKNCKKLEKVEFSTNVILEEKALDGIKNKENILSLINSK